MDKLSKIIEIPKDVAEKHDSIMSMMEQLKIQLKLWYFMSMFSDPYQNRELESFRRHHRPIF